MRDFIEREAAILEVQRYGVGCLDADDFTPEQAERFVISRLKAIPAADVRPVVKARWNVGADGWECSNCTIESNNTYPICPYCGADMREES